MQVNKWQYGILGIIILLMSCKKELTAEEYMSYVSNPDNGLRKTKAVDNFELDARYEPVDYRIAQHGKSIDREAYKQFEHFQFRIRLKDGGNILMYRETPMQNEVTRVNHFGFMAQQDFSICAGTDTNQCKQVHFSRNYNLSPSVDLSLAFDALPENSDWQLIYNDQQFNLGTVKFLFKAEDRNQLPELKQ